LSFQHPCSGHCLWPPLSASAIGTSLHTYYPWAITGSLARWLQHYHTSESPEELVESQTSDLTVWDLAQEFAL
jgi:hypothetical protein